MIPIINIQNLENDILFRNYSYNNRERFVRLLKKKQKVYGKRTVGEGVISGIRKY